MKKLSKKVKILIIIAAIICITAAVVPTTLALTSNKSEAATSTQKTYTVATGTITNEISAAGNLALSSTEDLAFEVAGTVYEVEVNVGDTVTKGQELAKLDTTEWDANIKTLQKAITTAQRALTSKQSALVTAQRNLAETQSAIAEKQLAVQNAQLSVTDAQLAVESANSTLYQINVVAAAQADVEAAELHLEAVNIAMEAVYGGGGDYSTVYYWQMQQQSAAAMLVEAKQVLSDILSESSVTLTTDAKLQIAQAELNIQKKQLAVTSAQYALQDAQTAVSDAQYAVTQAQAAVQSAQYDVDDAASALDDANTALTDAEALSPVITAPFDGFIPSISVQGGDVVYKGTVAMQIAYQDKFEVDMYVSEVNISNIKVGGTAYVNIDALNVTLPGTVTYIAPTATISSGVVNYKVTVEVESISDYITQLQTAAEKAVKTQAASSNTTMQTPPISQNGTAPQGFGQNSVINTLESIKLKAGMSVTVSLIISEASDVLVVPYSAITTQGPQSFVEVLNADGTTEKRAIVTGITDYSYTEVTSGLTAGEKIVLASSTTSSSSKTVTTTSSSSQNNNFMMPGLGNGGPSGGPPGGN